MIGLLQPEVSPETLRWRVLLEQGRSAAEHMARDAALAEEAHSAVRLFVWSPPAISHGWKQPVPAWFDKSQWAANGLEAVERPTGGGIAVHGSDVSIAIVVPRSRGIPLHELMRMVCENALALCRVYGAQAHILLDVPGSVRITYCLTEPSSYALLIGERKVAGFALRRYPKSWLIQGSLLVEPLPEVLRRAMPTEALASFEARAVPLAQAAMKSAAPWDVAQRWAAQWFADGAGSPGRPLEACGLQPHSL